ncbi:hypothetical protein J2X36_000126 [Methylobacterium sp. BE186]|uniref:hypothetical protein n=1 Tax=Methylobacterium sp. BE186 TaxID=2817715 RepID=UPI0028625965|nr:hypothetical protein [Methylobacterium sp. BE186]MDR7035391.1 hypothetical protein [Methylobacterium sp. BE186]
MERGDASRRQGEDPRDAAVRSARDALRDLRQSGVSPRVIREAETLEKVLDAETAQGPADRQPRRFGAFAGRFTIGPEFFEPLSEDERRAWGED